MHIYVWSLYNIRYSVVECEGRQTEFGEFQTQDGAASGEQITDKERHGIEEQAPNATTPLTTHESPQLAD